MQGSDKGHGIFSYAVGLSPYAPGFFVMLAVSARRRTGLFLMRTGLFLMLTWLFLMLPFHPAPSLPKPGFSLCSPVAPCTTIGFSLCSPLRPPSPPRVGRRRARLHEPRTTSAHTTVIRNALPQHWHTPFFFAVLILAYCLANSFLSVVAPHKSLDVVGGTSYGSGYRALFEPVSCSGRHPRTRAMTTNAGHNEADSFREISILVALCAVQRFRQDCHFDASILPDYGSRPSFGT